MDKLFTLRVRILGIIIITILSIYFLKGVSVGVGAFIDGFSAGYKSAKEKLEPYKQGYVVGESINPDDIFGEIVFKPTKTITSSGENIGKISIGNTKILFRCADVEVTNAPSQPLYISIAKAILLLLFISLIVWLFIKIWSIVGLLTKGDILKEKIIRTLKLIGILIIATEAVSIAYSYLEITHLKTFVKIPGYEIGLDYSLTTILFGVVLMLLSEILSYSTKIKEEQDLTI